MGGSPGGDGGTASAGLGIGGMGLAGEAGIGGAAAGTGTGVAGGMGAAGTGAIGGGGGDAPTPGRGGDEQVKTAAATVAKQAPQTTELAGTKPTTFETNVRNEMADRRGGAPISGPMGPMAPAEVRRRTLLGELGTGNAIATGAVIGELLGGNTGAVLGALTGAAAVQNG